MNKRIVFAANRNKVRGTLSRCLLGIVSLGALTLICFRLHLNIATVGFLYLIVLVLLSLTGDAISSIVSSIVAAGCLIWFFAPPIFSFRVNDPLDIAAIVAFLTTAAVISRLVSDMRRMSIESLSSVNRKLVDAEERERNRIARDLHDDVGQKLAMLAVELEQVQNELGDDSPELRARIASLQGQASEITGDVHSISHELHSSTLQYLGIEAAMRGFCREFGQQRKVQIDFAGKGLVTPLSPEISVCLYRVLQEALNNSTKYSGVQHFKVELFEELEGIHLVVNDSGIGFDPDSAIQS